MNNSIENDIVFRLRKRAEIRRQIPGRKSVEENKPDRIANILEEAAEEIERLRALVEVSEKSAMTYRELCVEWKDKSEKLRRELDENNLTDDWK